MQKNACLSCRQRKLRCDRQIPCANCVARSLECKQQPLSQVSQGIKRPHDESDRSTSSDILARLDYIEARINSTRKRDISGIVSSPIGNELNTIPSGDPTLTTRVPVPSSDGTTHLPFSEDGVLSSKPSVNDHILVCLSFSYVYPKGLIVDSITH